MSLDDFEELLADAPEDERWELTSGRVVRMMVGARWERNSIITNDQSADARQRSGHRAFPSVLEREGLEASLEEPRRAARVTREPLPHVATFPARSGTEG